MAAQNSNGTAPRRIGRPWPKGVSGNPGGRPKVILEVRNLARQHTKAAILALVDVMHMAKNPGARVAAAQALLDRGWGKAMQPLLEESTGPLEIRVSYVRRGLGMKAEDAAALPPHSPQRPDNGT